MTEWIYLSDEIILGELTNEKGNCALAHFIERVLFKYKRDIDYKKIDKNNELVTLCPSKTNKNKVKQTTKLYYAVTKEIYDKLLIEGKIRKSKVILHPEQIISNKLSETLGGKREVVLACKKRIDVVSDEEVIEVKQYKSRLAAIGQILYYSKTYPNKIKRIHLFDHCGQMDKLFESICSDLNIIVTYEC